MSAQEQLGLQFDPITTHELPDLTSARASREVSPSDFQQIAQRGHDRLERMNGEIHDIHPLTNNLTAASQAAYKAAKEPWGGQTINPRSGQAVDFHYPDKYAMAARDPGQEPVTMPSSVNYQQFREHMGATLSFQFVNVLNHFQPANPTLNIDAPATFGVVTTQANNPRQMEFGLRIFF